jgi:2-hydroxychromene-2-carboxylate isomerase
VTMLEMCFDCGSPWTYFAFHAIQPLARDLGIDITWRPVLVGGIFNAVNPSVYESRMNAVPAKRRYMHKDILDSARFHGLKVVFPPTVFPVNSVKAMRGCVFLEPQGKLVPFARAAFEYYWGEDQDISQDAVLQKVCERAGVDATALLAGISTQAVKDKLRANTDEAIRRGAFGSPTAFVDRDDMYFGSDRLHLVREALLRSLARRGVG